MKARHLCATDIKAFDQTVTERSRYAVVNVAAIAERKLAKSSLSCGAQRQYLYFSTSKGCKASKLSTRTLAKSRL